MLKKRFMLIFVLIVLLFINLDLASTEEPTGCCANPSALTCENDVRSVDCCGYDQTCLDSYFFGTFACSEVPGCLEGRGCCVDSCTDNVYKTQCAYPDSFESQSCSEISPCQEGCAVCTDGTQAGYVTLSEGEGICDSLDMEVDSFTQGEQCTGREEPGEMTVLGYVTDIDSGNPIEDATVVAPGKTAITDDTGYYSLDDIPTGSYTIITSAVGYKTNFSDITGIPNDEIIWDIKLEKSTTAGLSGTVVNIENVKLRGVLIHLIGTNFERAVYTDSKGEYSIANIPAPATYTVTASKAGYDENEKEIDLIKGPNELNFILIPSEEKLGTVMGHVYDKDENPLEDATVEIGGKSAPTDEDGYYIINRVNIGSHSAQASKQGYKPETKPVTVLEGQESIVDFYLTKEELPPPETADIHVIVKDSETVEPKERIPYTRLNLNKVGVSTTEAFADEYGEHTFLNYEVGYDYFVEGWKEGYIPNKTETFTLIEDTTVVLAMQKWVTYTVTVTIKNIYEEPIPEINVFLSNTKHAAQTNNEGIAVLEEVVPGEYVLNAQDPTHLYAPNRTVVMVEKDEQFNIIMLVSECWQDRGSLVLEPIEVIKSKPEVRLNWGVSCPVENFFVYRCEGADCEPSEAIEELEGKTTTFTDTIEARKTYCYKVEAYYPEAPRPGPPLPDSQFSEKECIDTGDEYCFSLRKQFCTNGPDDFTFIPKPPTHITECDDLNFFVNKKDCRDLGEDYICTGPDKNGIATCVHKSECDKCNDPLGIFSFNGEILYKYIDEIKGEEVEEILSCNDQKIKTCYLDYTNTSIDKYYGCENIESCYDYKSGQPCKENRCLGEIDCAWEDYSLLGETYPEIGFGVCHPIEEELQDCSLCGDDRYNNIFGKCTEPVCDLFGDCYYKGGSSACLHKRNITCFNYDNQEDCTGADNTNVEIDVVWKNQEKESGTNRVLQESEDIFGFGKCKWAWIDYRQENLCIKDSDDSYESNTNDPVDGCDPFDLSCRRDVISPETTIPYSTLVKDIDFEVFATDINGIGEENTRDNIITYYQTCVAEGGAYKEPAKPVTGMAVSGFGGPCSNCYPTTLVIEKDGEYRISEVRGDGRYALCYFSEDNSKNLEEVKYFYVSVDTTPPIVTVTYTEEPHFNGQEGITDLTINLNVNELAYCVAWLNDTDGNNVAPENNIQGDGKAWTRVYDDLEDGYYEYIYNCTDTVGNSVHDKVVINLNADRTVYDQSPIGKINTNTPMFEVYTQNQAECRYSEIPLDFDLIEGIFGTEEGLYHKKEMDFSPETAKPYEFWVFCKFEKDGKVYGDEGDKIIFTIDMDASITIIEPDLTGWFTDDVTFRLTCKDPIISGGAYKEFGCIDSGDGVAGVYYCDHAYDCNPIYEGEPVVVKTVEKSKDVYFFSRDDGGNAQQPLIQHHEIRIDRQKPMIDRFETPFITNKKSVTIEGDIGNYVFYDETGDDLDELEGYNFKDFDFKTKLNFTMDTERKIYDSNITFKYQDGENYYLLMFDIISAERIELFKVVNGNQQRIEEKTGLDLTEEEWHDLRIKTNGPAIDIYWDDKLAISATDSTFGAGQIKPDTTITDYENITVSDERLASPIAKIIIYLNGDQVAEETNPPSYHFSEDVELLQNQENTVKIYVEDEAGWYNEIYFTIIHDGMAPEITDVYVEDEYKGYDPENPLVVEYGYDSKIKVWAVDMPEEVNAGIDSVWIILKGREEIQLNYEDNYWTADLDTSEWRLGSHKIEIVAKDAASNTASKKIAIIVNDTVPPFEAEFKIPP